MGQITERIQMIRLCCFRYAVDDRTGFCAIDTIDQLPCMFMQAEAAELNILVREYRCSGGTETANPVIGNRCSGTRIPHLMDYYLRVYSLNAGSNPYTSRMDL